MMRDVTIGGIEVRINRYVPNDMIFVLRARTNTWEARALGMTEIIGVMRREYDFTYHAIVAGTSASDPGVWWVMNNALFQMIKRAFESQSLIPHPTFDR